MQAERASRLALADRHGQNASANNLGNKRDSEGDKSEYQRRHFGHDLKSTFEIEMRKLCDIKRKRGSGHLRHERQGTKDERRNNEKRRSLSTSPVLSSPGPRAGSDPANHACSCTHEPDMEFRVTGISK